MAQEVQDLQLKVITTVQLPAGPTAQRRFLKKQQAALGSEGELSALTTGQSDNVFVVPAPPDIPCERRRLI